MGSDRQVTPDGTPATQLWIRFKCQDCRASDHVNVYRGAPYHCGKPMIAYLYDKDNHQRLRP